MKGEEEKGGRGRRGKRVGGEGKEGGGVVEGLIGLR